MGKSKRLYLYHVSDGLAQKALKAKLIDINGHITRKVCNCTHSPHWGAAYHRNLCPVKRFYKYGGIYASDILENVLEDLENECL